MDIFEGEGTDLMKDIIILFIGYLIGIVFTWITIKQYKKAQGYNSDPLDGKEPTGLERLIKNNENQR